ncbi:hypothetical protein RY27_26785, partial [Litorilinea aerophila]
MSQLEPGVNGRSRLQAGDRLGGRLRLGLLMAFLLAILLAGLLFSAPTTAAPAVQPAEEGILAIVGANEASLYDAPGGTALRSLAPGTVLTAVGRTADTRWLVVYVDAQTVGWVERSQIVAFGLEDL